MTVSNPLDDPTCHDCPIAQAVRADRDDLLAEIARLKGTSVAVQRVSHGEANDNARAR